MSKVGAYWRTIRHLRGRQISSRIFIPIRRILSRPDFRPPPPRRERHAGWITPARRTPSMLNARTFRFLEIEHQLAPGGWDDQRLSRLWRYNLHYFDDLNSSEASERNTWHKELIQNWVCENSPGAGTAWEPYPTSIRIVNWIKYFLGGQDPSEVWLASLATQVRWLSRHLEWHLLGNHLFANAKALVYAGIYFGGAEAGRWLNAGLSIIERELGEQILADGGHFERSPMYHALALEDVLDLVNLIEAFVEEGEPRTLSLLCRLREAAAKMVMWMRLMTHPDGCLGHFNDTAQGIAAPAVELERYANELGLVLAHRSTQCIAHMRPSGYIVARCRDVHLIADVAPLGPDYLLGHAHADTLSFELSIGRRRVIINGGTSVYEDGPRRHFERGTAAHSTVEIGRENSSEVWSAFRVGRRARPVGLEVREDGFSCAHSGYGHLRGKPEHKRTWRIAAGQLSIIDTVTSTQVAAVARYHLAPGLFISRHDGATWLVTDGATVVVTLRVQAGRASISDSTYAPTFGAIMSTKSINVELIGGQAITSWRWNEDAHPILNR